LPENLKPSLDRHRLGKVAHGLPLDNTQVGQTASNRFCLLVASETNPRSVFGGKTAHQHAAQHIENRPRPPIQPRTKCAGMLFADRAAAPVRGLQEDEKE
jgi:hypothetical protein